MNDYIFINTLRKYTFSLPFSLMAVCFLGLSFQHWFALIPMFACLMFGIGNYKYFDIKIKNDLGGLDE